ncbi:SrfA family protein [Pectobacterium betavasculorum]|uniref:SrfA n=1 Tax=Pectobacterium betavasculorum TaxID=55207 RepID=A0ABR4V3U4_9GAMM|nr:SrfA family protein [Pectobacterium betavasculorum]KFX22203.1 SrfA [Pectobacterium betavasculorum]
MAKLFLRSGSLDDFLALGENGQPVYASALQLRETLRLRKQQQIADCLAIPQPNEHGDRIDWYSPVDGKVTSWIAASEEERKNALSLLETYQTAVADISQRAQNAEKAGQKLFGVLLAKAIQFPGANHVYLVDGKPVLTFWGFVNLDKKSRLDALDCLRPIIKETEPLFVAPTPAASVPTPPLADPVPEPETQPMVQPEPIAPTPVPAAALPTRPPFFRLWWLLPAAALLAILSLQIRGCVSEQEKQTSEQAATVKSEKRALPSSTPAEPTPPPAPPVAEKEIVKATEPPISAPPVVSPAPIVEAAKPEAPATVEPKEPVEPVVEQVPALPAGKDDLVMPADAVKIGSIKFLNGNWRVIVDGKAPITGRPPSLRYQIQNGKGTARITHGDGVTCRANVEAGLMSSGNLIINSRSGARCSDNSRFQMPELVCKQGASGTAAECIGRYDADTVFPMTIKRESK